MAEQLHQLHQMGALVVLLLALAACDKAVPLPQPGADSGGTVTYWRGDEEFGMRLYANRVEQIGDTQARLRLDGVRVELPLEQGTVYVHADQAVHEAKGQTQVQFSSPVHLHGRLQGRAVIGRAEQAQLRRRDRSLVLSKLSLVGSDGHLQVEEWILRAGAAGEMRGMQKTAAGPAWQAVTPILDGDGIE